MEWPFELWYLIKHAGSINYCKIELILKISIRWFLRILIFKTYLRSFFVFNTFHFYYSLYVFNRMHAFMQCGSILHFFLFVIIYLRQICICLFCRYFAMLEQTCRNLHKLAQTCSNLHKLAQNCTRLGKTRIFSPAPLVWFVQLCISPSPFGIIYATV